jgi:hypothetical protein
MQTIGNRGSTRMIFNKRKSLSPTLTLYLNSNDCLIKVQISDERSGFGLRIYFNLFKSYYIIEKGRCKNIPSQHSLCNTCNNIEDEDHFF